MAEKRRKTLIKKWPLDRAYPWILIVLLAWFIADLSILKVRPLMLPTQSPPSRPIQLREPPLVDASQFKDIADKNIFAMDGKIPPALIPKGQAPGEEKPGEDAPPQLSALPLVLIGTLVHSDPAKSIATIQVKSKNATIALRVGKEIEGVALVTKVERQRAYIKNLNNGRNEYIEMKMDNKLSFGLAKLTGPEIKAEVKAVGQGKFEISRADVNKYTADLAGILQQAAMQPRRNANGEIECFKFVAIQPKSIFTQLGLQVGDCLNAVNGEKVDSPAKAMELYQALKTSNSINLGLERDGRPSDFSYTIK